MSLGDDVVILVPEDGANEAIGVALWNLPDDLIQNVKIIPTETYNRITEFLADPSKGVRLERPGRKPDDDVAV